jgi:single-stranded-DNA-specific exonuclease
VEPVDYAKTLGIDVVVTDHHRPGTKLPDAVAVVNPYREDSTTTFKDLCGAGVAFKVMDALVQRLAPEHRTAFHNNFVDLVALGTVADCTPIRSENRVLVAHGLKTIAAAKKTGIKALLLSMDINGRPLTTEDISFKLGPRLNAAGRIEDADLAFRLLTTKDPDEAEQLAVQIGALAEKSREETARVTTEALIDALSPEHQTRRVLVLARERWGKGVVGIAAARIVEHCRKPVILLSFDAKTEHWHGSARSWGAFNLHEEFHKCAELPQQFRRTFPGSRRLSAQG